MPVSSCLPASKQDLLSELADGLEADALNWLSGYFAGVAQGRPNAAEPALATPPISAVAQASPDRRATILYGSQTGNAKRIAETLSERLTAEGLPARLVRADRYATKELKDERLLYVVMSTQGDGEPPDDSMAFVEFLLGRRAPKLPQLQYGVLGLGDSSYPLFCGISQRIDARLAELGGQRLLQPGAADLDIATIAEPWQQEALAHARKQLAGQERVSTPLRGGSVTPLRPKTPVGRDHPCQAELLLNQRITGRDSAKDVRHLEISLEGSSLDYQPGDALGIWPSQSEVLVDRILEATQQDGGQMLRFQDKERTLRDWLTHHRELTQLTRPFLAAHAERAGSPELQALLAPEGFSGLRSLLESRQVIDVLRTWPAAWTADDLVATLRPLAPRLYSIASSPLAVEDEVHLTVAHVQYEHEGESRWGVTSDFLASLEEGARLPVFVEENTRFRLPADGDRDIIMIGPGTGVAPFRAFVQHRAACGARGRNWLFFGNPHFASDFLYQAEWQRALQESRLHRLDLAFSRDQGAKRYVQHRLWEKRAEIHEWIEAGAHVYVCGDATRMARDVHDTLLRIAREEGKRDESQARAWLEGLAAQGRYARDVY